MANFELIKPQIIPMEGVYVFDPDDPGGETKYGISKRSYPNIDIKNLSLDDAAVIYKRDFWDVMNLDKVNVDIIAQIIFWFGVNAGVVTSSKLTQKVVNLLGICKFFLKEDGIIGDKTIDELNFEHLDNHKYELSFEQNYFILRDSLKLEQVQYYANIVNRNPSQGKFLLGWINRVFKI